MTKKQRYNDSETEIHRDKDTQRHRDTGTQRRRAKDNVAEERR